MTRDEELGANINVFEIPGLRLRHTGKGRISLFGTLFAFSNWKVGFKIAEIITAYIFNPVLKFLVKDFAYKSTSRYFREFDFAVVDFENMLPWAAKTRKKNYISIDSLHAMLVANFDKGTLTLQDRYKLALNRLFVKIYHPRSKEHILTTIYNFPLRAKYKKLIKEVGPLVRRSVLDYKDKVKYEDFILVYVRQSIRDKILPALKEIPEFNFVVFTERLFEEEEAVYAAPNIEFHDVNPKAFIDYLARCKAVVSTGGITLISESLVLKKPFYAVIIGGVLGFEQRVSLYSLRKIECGDGCKITRFTTAKLKHFLDNVDQYDENAKNVNLVDNTDYVSEHIKGLITK